MRILIVYFNYPQLSATYLEAEIRYFQRHGIDIEVWSECEPGAAYVPSCKVHRGTLSNAETDFQPDIVHFYWVKMAVKHLDSVLCPNITIRDHSFGLDAEDRSYLLSQLRVRAIFLFPHELMQGQSEKLHPLTVAYDSTRFPTASDAVKQTDMVVCCTAGLPKKSLETFIQTAALCPNHRFILAVATCTGHGETVQHCIDLNRRLGSPAEIRVDVPHTDIIPLMQSAGSYLCTQNSQKRGMPIAVAEALASGCYILIPQLPWLEAMIADHGVTYDGPSEAAKAILETSDWPSHKWKSLSINAAEYGFGRFSDQMVLPKVIQTWSAIIEKPQ